MSELEHCRLAHEGKLDSLIEKIKSNQFVDLSRKKDQSGRAALHWAAVGSKKDVVEYLFSEHNVPLDEPDEIGWTPLMIASSVGSSDLVQFFLDRNCDPNSSNETKQRALHYSCSKNKIEISRMLLDRGAECNAVDEYGASALHRAASKGNSKIVDLLLTNYKANVNIIDSEGNTPLHLACEEERIEVAKILLRHGANPYIKNKDEKTPIDVSNGGLLNLISMSESSNRD